MIYDLSTVELEKRFKPAFQSFKKRVKEFGNLDACIGKGDEDALRVLLDGLIRARRRLKKSAGD
jgi:hypothetical protein